MYKYKPEGGLPIYSYIPKDEYLHKGDNPNSVTMAEQAENAAKLPFAFHHVALMADGHVGYGVPIGSVVATQGAVVPFMVGVDIGCGMIALRTNLTNISQDVLKNVMRVVRETVPVGFKHREQPISGAPMLPKPDERYEVVNRHWYRACKQIGTLGGGRDDCPQA